MEIYADSYLRQQMIAGEILKADTQWILNEGVLVLQKHCICREMIGRPGWEQIGDIHE